VFNIKKHSREKICFKVDLTKPMGVCDREEPVAEEP